MLLGEGRVSWFGGPDDMGVAPDEGLALIYPLDLRNKWFANIFLDAQPANTTGLARRLNPQTPYLAMRWGYGSYNGVKGEILPNYSREQIRRAIFRISANGKSVLAQAADWGPNLNTGRLADCSPMVLKSLGIETDDLAQIELVDI